jgi:hypothetical protein
MKLLLALFALCFSQVAYADTQAECVSKAEMQEIAARFPQYRDLANKDYCYDGSHTSHLIAGIMFMRQTQFNMPMQPSKDELFSGKFASNWFNYFVGRINEFEIDEGCPKGVAAYVYAFGGRTMYACTMVLSDNFTSMDLASVFMHEARHIDGYPHMTCTKGARAGLQGACDTRISDTGSYAVTVETYAQLARYAVGIHPALKTYARSAAVVYADEAFENTVRVERTPQFLALTNDRRFHKVRADSSVEALGLAPELGKIVMRSQHMILFPSDLNSKARFVFAREEGEIAQQAGDLAAEWNGQTPEQKASLVDIHVGAQWNIRVYKDKIRFSCDPRSATTRDIQVKELPVGMVYLEGYDRGAKMAQLMAESGKVYDVGCNGTTPVYQASRATLDQKYKSLYKVNGFTLGLTADGFLREIQGSTSRPFSLPGLDGNIVEIAPNASFAFFNER